MADYTDAIIQMDDAIDYAQLLCNGFGQANEKLLKWARKYEVEAFEQPDVKEQQPSHYAHYDNYTQQKRLFNYACDWWHISEELFGTEDMWVAFDENKRYYRIPVVALQQYLKAQSPD